MVVQEDCPVRLKKIIGESHLLVGSRFHALVSALSQAVPAVGTSWSHKYEMLFEDYNCSDYLVDLEKNMKEVVQAALKNHDLITQELAVRGLKLCKDSEKMWYEVDNVIFS